MVQGRTLCDEVPILCTLHRFDPEAAEIEPGENSGTASVDRTAQRRSKKFSRRTDGRVRVFGGYCT
jgi:hypothetical protein